MLPRVSPHPSGDKTGASEIPLSLYIYELTARLRHAVTARRLHDAAAPTATASLCVVLAVLPAEPPVVRHQPVKPVAADDGAHPKERKVTAQSRRGGGTSFPQLGHGEHEKMSGDVVVLQCRVGSRGACMGSARAQREARGAICKDVLESVTRNVARNGTDFRGARFQMNVGWEQMTLATLTRLSRPTIRPAGRSCSHLQAMREGEMRTRVQHARVGAAFTKAIARRMSACMTPNYLVALSPTGHHRYQSHPKLKKYEAGIEGL